MRLTRENGLTPLSMRGTTVGDHELGEGLKLAATAVASAVVVATLVIAVGGPILDRRGEVDSARSGQAALVQTGG